MTRLRFIIAALAIGLVAAPAIGQQQAPIYRDRNGNYQGAQGVMVMNPDGTVAAQTTGQTTSANSQSVVPASNSAPFPVNLLNGSTAANFTNNAPGGIGATGGVDKLSTVSYNQMLDGAVWRQQSGNASGNLFVLSRGSDNLQSAQVSVGTTAVAVVAARSGRARLTLGIGAANACYLGNSAVTTANGYPLPPTANASITLQTAATAFVVCSATTTISVLEEY